MPRNYTPKSKEKIDWTKPFRGYNGSTVYEFVETMLDAGDYCHVIKSVKKKGIHRIVNDYGFDVGGQKLVSQRLPKPEPKVREKIAEASNIDTLVLSKKIDVTAEILRGNFVAMKEELKQQLAEHSFDMRTLYLEILALIDKVTKLEHKYYGPVEFTADHLAQRITRNDSVQGYGTQGSLFDERPA